MLFRNPLFIKIIIHVLFWILFTCVSLLVFSDYYWTKNPFIQFLSILIAIVYVNNLFLLPFFVRKKWYLGYISLFGVIAFLATELYCKVFTRCGCTILKCMSDYLWQTLVPLIFFSFIWMLFRNMDKQKELDEVKKKHTEMELQFLKSQINPHVLLNNLNTIYSFSLDKPNEVPDLILKLSDNLKHVLYESNEEYISLDKELSFIDNFIAFQRLRVQGVKTIEYSKSIESSTLKIAPLLLITIIENAFKHSIINSNITINVTSQSSLLKLVCTNQYKIENSPSESGIGLNNLEKRLNLLYPNKHKLIINQNEVFKVTLNLELG